jgi:UDP-N-acetylglucosamine/UDP-N-acetylgalactosamine diphosphorylase
MPRLRRQAPRRYLGPMPDRLQAIRATLQTHRQEHLLAFFDGLAPAQQKALLDQIEAINFTALDALIEKYVRRKPVVELPSKIEPAPYYPADGEYDAAKYRSAGEELIRAGKVAAFTVAGGQGTRLGWDGPKGTFPATVVTGKPLFRVFAEQIIATQKKYNVGRLPWYIMTSPINDADTRAFFADNNYFGLSRRDVIMFPQGVLPSIDAKTGRLLLSEKHEVAVNPDGHGGSIKALRDSGAVEDMVARGIEHISYFQVDNPLVKCIDPLFLGLHATAPDSSAEMSSKMVAKAYPEEKVGVFCRDGSTGKIMVIEYSDLPMELAKQKNERGQLRFNAGSIAIHILGVKFVERLTANANRFALPYHRADKKVPHIDPETGARIEPTEPNAVKLEAFVFDAIPLAENSIVLETRRIEEFAPIKNAEGIDSPATSHQIQSDRNAAWLSRFGVRVPQQNGHVNARIEINPLTALEPDDLVKANLPREIAPGQEVVL